MTSLTTAERALDLFRQRPAGEDRIDWLANQLLALAAESGFLSLRIVQSVAGPAIECSDSAQAVTSEEPGPLRLFRTLLARFAKMAEEENGTAFDPYGGKLHFDRPGPVRLNVEFTNTTVTQSVTLTKVVPSQAATITVTKLECARRQLETAIVLFFEDGDPVSVHTLACAAYQIIFDINDHRGGNPMFVKDRYLTTKPPGTSKLINQPQNFFKHADNDPDDSLEFSPENTGAYIVDACRTYTELTGERPHIFNCFRAWLTCSQPEMFDFPPENKHFAEEMVRLYARNDRQGFVDCFLRETAPATLGQ